MGEEGMASVSRPEYHRSIVRSLGESHCMLTMLFKGFLGEIYSVCEE
ncbi:hypothetical protein TNIN_476541, partial [Trichonephila inaurata madagascariensis]